MGNGGVLFWRCTPSVVAGSLRGWGGVGWGSGGRLFETALVGGCGVGGVVVFWALLVFLGMEEAKALWDKVWQIWAQSVGSKKEEWRKVDESG